MLGGPGRGGAGRNDNVDPEGSQLGREAREPLGLPLGISVFDHEVAAAPVLTKPVAAAELCVAVERQLPSSPTPPRAASSLVS